MRTKKPNSLARIPLQWMIRECFKVGTSIIFDMCMLMHVAGLDMEQEMGRDIGPTLSPPDPLLAKNLALAKPEAGEHKGYSSRSIPATVIPGLSRNKQ